MLDPSGSNNGPCSSELAPSVISDDEVNEIKNICLEVMTHFASTSDPPSGRDPILYDLCCQDAKSRGYCPDHPLLASFFATWVHSGISYSSIAYAHLQTPSLRVYVALYAAFLLYLDDTYSNDVTGLATFHVRFCKAEWHDGNVVLDYFSSFLRDAHAYFDYMAANIIITGALNFVTGLSLEHRTKTIKLSLNAKRFPKFVRGFAAADACSIFIFPPEVSVDSYIQALPELTGIITGVNDVLSFYKEELAGDDRNLVSITARCLGLKKIVVLRDLAKEVIETDKNVRLVLEDAALKAYNAFAEQYVAFHRSLPRYRLNELTEGERLKSGIAIVLKTKLI